MEIEVQLISEPIAEKITPPASGFAGAWTEFRGIVRDEENGALISALEYEAYAGMAGREIRRLLEEISKRHSCLATKVIHRIGMVPAGQAAIYVGVAAKHRAEAFALMAEFMDRLKQDVPIWKRRALPIQELPVISPKPGGGNPKSVIPLDEALVAIGSRCVTLPGVRMPVAETASRVLRETIFATDDSPDCDRSTRDGFAILGDDNGEVHAIMDTMHAADWKPRRLNPGEAVRVATGTALPCENLRVLMQENVERTGDRIKVIRRESSANVRRRGEDWRAGDAVLRAGKKLDAGTLALLASAGCVQPVVSPRLQVMHFTTGDEIIPIDQMSKPGQVRDSNSILIRALLEKSDCVVKHAHLPEDFPMAKKRIEDVKSEVANAGLVLISGGASVGDKDFTRPLLEWLGFEIVFSQVNIRPGRPLIFGMSENRLAFGLPGNPLSHFVCFHIFVAAALAKIHGAEPEQFVGGVLAEKLEDAPNPRETLWPGKLALIDGRCELKPLRWSSSGDLACLAEANALIRVPVNCDLLAAGTKVQFLPV